MNKLVLDSYTLRARLWPVLIVILPLAFALLAWLPGLMGAWGAIWSLIVSCGGLMLLAQFGRDFGKNREPRLYRLWGGKPTTRMLRYRDATNTVTLSRWHKSLQELLPAVKMPTAAEEIRDSVAADAVYESCVQFLRERTRDAREFSLIFQENCNYGFRRNMWGMKPIGLTITVVSTIAVAAVLVLNNVVNGLPVMPAPILYEIMNLALLIMWAKSVNPGWVKMAAEAYAERLLSTCEIVASQLRDKSREARDLQPSHH